MTKLEQLSCEIDSLSNHRAKVRLANLISKGLFTEALAYIVGSTDYIDWPEEEQRLLRIRELLFQELDKDTGISSSTLKNCPPDEHQIFCCVSKTWRCN